VSPADAAGPQRAQKELRWLSGGAAGCAGARRQGRVGLAGRAARGGGWLCSDTGEAGLGERRLRSRQSPGVRQTDVRGSGVAAKWFRS